MLHYFWYINHLYIQTKVFITYKTVEWVRITDKYIDITETIESAMGGCWRNSIP